MTMRSRGRRQGGFTYVALLLAVALMSASLAWSGQSWQLARQREMERQLLFAGREIRDAIAAYHRSGPVRGQLPDRLEELLADHRGVRVARHLRRLYPDPMGNGWVEIRDAGGALIGVHSGSVAVPLKRSGFGRKELAFEGAATYADWRFTVEPVVRMQGDVAGQREFDIRSQYRPGAHIGSDAGPGGSAGGDQP